MFWLISSPVPLIDVVLLRQSNDNKFIHAKSCALTVAVVGSENRHIHCFKENQPCHAGLKRLRGFQKTMSNSGTKYRFDGITESDVEKAAQASLIIDASDTDAIDVKQINSSTLTVYLLLFLVT